jgi:hypothetical protein
MVGKSFVEHRERQMKRTNFVAMSSNTQESFRSFWDTIGSKSLAWGNSNATSRYFDVGVSSISGILNLSWEANLPWSIG